MILNPAVKRSGEQSKEYSIQWNLVYDGSYYAPRESAAAGEVVTDWVYLMKGSGSASITTADGVTIPATTTITTASDGFGKILNIKFVMPASDVTIT